MVQDNRSGTAKPGAAEASEFEKLEQVAGTDHGRRIAPRRWARRIFFGLVGRLALVAAVLSVSIKVFVCDRQAVDCLEADRDTPAGVLASACQAEYEETGDPRVGLELARALYRGKSDDAAEVIARPLLLTAMRSDALTLLGRIAKRDEDKPREVRFHEARSALERARDLHRRENRLVEVAGDEQALALIYKDEKSYAEALRMLDHCIRDARAGGPQGRVIEGYCHVTAALILNWVGYIRGALRELESAEPLLKAQRDLASLYVEEANVHQERGENAQAVFRYREALRIAEEVQNMEMAIRAHLNLAYSLAETGSLDEAARHLAEAEEIAPDYLRPERIHQAARIAYHRRDLAQAASLLEQAASEVEDEENEEKVDIAVLRARIALEQKDLRTAEVWARRGIEQVEQVREKQPIQLRGWTLSSRRSPYEILFAALARAGRNEEAVIAFDQWYGRTLLDSLAQPNRTEEPSNLGEAAFRTEELNELVPALTAAPIMRQEDPRVVLDAVRSADLLALVIAEAEVWRVTVVGGSIQLVNLGPFEATERLMRRLIATPTNPDLAEQLGQLILPADLVRDADDALRVILDGELARLPVVALRRGGRPLIAARPIVRTPRLSAVRCAPPLPAPRGALILADPRGDLPAARIEANRVAALFGATALVGDAVTKDALLGAARTDLLHLATHAELPNSVGHLVFADGKVSALQIFAKRLSVARVVLAACGSALASDNEGATSLVTAFLAGGAVQVVATLRPVTDAGSEDLTRLFYRAQGATDPVRALQSVQKELAKTTNVDWPFFAVFGQETCRTTP